MILKLSSLFALIFCISANASTTLVGGEGSGIRVVDPLVLDGAGGFGITQNENNDVLYPYWGSYCNSSRDYLCSKVPPKPTPQVRFVGDAVIEYTVGNIWEEATILKGPQEDKNRRFPIFNYGGQGAAYMRREYTISIVDIGNNLKSVESACSVREVAAEEKHTRLYILGGEVGGWSTCRVSINSKVPDAPFTVSIGQNSIQWRIGPGLFQNQYQTGKYLVEFYSRDKFVLKPGNITLVDGANWRTNVFFDGILTFKTLYGTENVKLTLDPTRHPNNVGKTLFDLRTTYSKLRISSSCDDCYIENRTTKTKIRFTPKLSFNNTTVGLYEIGRIGRVFGRENGLIRRFNNHGALFFYFNNDDINSAVNKGVFDDFRGGMSFYIEPELEIGNPNQRR